MEYKIGSLGDIISGIESESTSGNKIAFVPIPVKHNVSNSSPKKEENLKKTRHENIFSFNRNRTIKKYCEKEVTRDVEKESRTIIVKNVPLKLRKGIVKQFKKHGKIHSVRFRCVAPNDAGLNKKTMFIQEKFHPERTNANAFICYEDIQSVEGALSENGTNYEGYHIFVDRVVNRIQRDPKKAIYLGNVPFGSEENEIWKIFEQCGEIDDIRIVRDSVSGIGKGFAYINFKNADAVELALSLNGVELNSRALRVSRAKPSRENLKVKKRGSGLQVKSKNVSNNELAFKKNDHVPKKDEIEHIRSMKINSLNRNDRMIHGKNNIKGYGVNDSQIREKSFSGDSMQKQKNELHYQGQKMTDKKKKKRKKINKDMLRKKINAKILCGKK